MKKFTNESLDLISLAQKIKAELNLSAHPVLIFIGEDLKIKFKSDTDFLITLEKMKQVNIILKKGSSKKDNDDNSCHFCIIDVEQIQNFIKVFNFSPNTVSFYSKMKTIFSKALKKEENISEIVAPISLIPKEIIFEIMQYLDYKSGFNLALCLIPDYFAQIKKIQN